MYSTFNERKSVVAERFIRTLENKIFKHLTAISKNVYFDVLDDIVNKYNNTIRRTTKMKPIDVIEEIFVIKKVKNTVPWTYVINDINSEEIIRSFYEKKLQKTNQKEFRIEKILKRKGKEEMLNGKDMTIHLIVGLIKKISYKKSVNIFLNHQVMKKILKLKLI